MKDFDVTENHPKPPREVTIFLTYEAVKYIKIGVK
jgi:hypothetical protein